MNNIWFIADTHFSHGNIIKYCHRIPWLTDEYLEIHKRYTSPECTWEDVEAVRSYKLPKENVDAHDEALIGNWNALVKKGDRVFHLGDFCWGYPDHIRKIRSRLNGNIHLILGNHDKQILKSSHQLVSEGCFRSIDLRIDNLKVSDPGAKDFHGRQPIVLSHYSMRVWDQSHYGSYMLYGHSHGQLIDDPKALSFDVGVDATAMRLAGDGEVKAEYYRPISYEEVKHIMVTVKAYEGPDFSKGIKGPEQ